MKVLNRLMKLIRSRSLPAHRDTVCWRPLDTPIFSNEEYTIPKLQLPSMKFAIGTTRIAHPKLFTRFPSPTLTRKVLGEDMSKEALEKMLTSFSDELRVCFSEETGKVLLEVKGLSHELRIHRELLVQARSKNVGKEMLHITADGITIVVAAGTVFKFFVFDKFFTKVAKKTYEVGDLATLILFPEREKGVPSVPEGKVLNGEEMRLNKVKHSPDSETNNSHLLAKNGDEEMSSNQTKHSPDSETNYSLLLAKNGDEEMSNKKAKHSPDSESNNSNLLAKNGDEEMKDDGSGNLTDLAWVLTLAIIVKIFW